MPRSAFLVPLLVMGCDKAMTEDDCRKIGQNLRTAWEAEAQKAAPEDSEGTEKTAGVLKVEGEKLMIEWIAECKKDMLGKRMDSGEVKCLMEAKTLDEIRKCAD